MGYESLHALEEAGGLDALYVEPGVSTASSTSDAGKPVTISGTGTSPYHALPATIYARQFRFYGDGVSALVLIFWGTQMESAAVAAALVEMMPAETIAAETIA